MKHKKLTDTEKSKILNNMSIVQQWNIEHLADNMPMMPEHHPEDPEDDDKPETCMVKIDMLRTGKFIRASWFGNYVLSIDAEMLQKMKDNFEKNVIDRKVPLDVNHNKEEAYGWLESLSIESREVKGKMQTFLVGEWCLYPKGIELVKNKVYSMFSIEFHPNYSDREVYETTKTPEGVEQPLGDITYYGPTILGGALTNRPFIPNMNEINLSEEGFKFSENNNVCFMREYSFDDAPVAGKIDSSGSNGDAVVKNLDNGADSKSGAKNTILDLKSFKPHSNTERKVDKTALKNIVQFMESQLSGLDKSSPEYKTVSENLEKAKKELSDFDSELSSRDSKIKQLSDENINFNEDFKKLASKVVTLENEQKRAAADLAIQTERARQSEINSFCDGLTSKGATKPLVAKVKSLLLSDMNQKEIVSLKEGDNVVSLNLRGVISQIIDVLPPAAFVNTGESTTTASGAPAESVRSNELSAPGKDKETSEIIEASTKATMDRRSSKLKNGSSVIRPAADPIPGRK